MATDNKHILTLAVKAGEALDMHQYQAVALDDGKVANNGAEAIGILINKPKINEHAQVVVDGVCKYRAGLAIAIGKRITVTTSGYCTLITSGSYSVGIALEAATSGSIGKGLFRFGNALYGFDSDFCGL